MSSSSRFTRMATTIVQGLVALLLVAALVIPEALSFAQADRSHRFENVSGTSAAFRMKGAVKGLFPGKRKVMKVKLRNPNRFAIVVKELRIRVRPSTDPGCGSRWLSVRQRLRVSVVVPARGRAKKGVPVRLKPTAPTSCQGARWPLKFRGGAVRKR
ncbi:MAG: hypothetical protein M3391_11830 [Actinomycetota bacterium]|nr:hypothetical protein [Actinomycetota bacterium]